MSQLSHQVVVIPVEKTTRESERKHYRSTDDVEVGNVNVRSLFFLLIVLSFLKRSWVSGSRSSAPMRIDVPFIVFSVVLEY